MKFNNVYRTIVVSAILSFISATACAAPVVTIGFSSVGTGTPAGVPLSPWGTALLAGLLLLSAAILLRKRTRSGWFILMLSVIVGSGIAVKSEEIMATTATLNLVTSPTISPDLGFNVCAGAPAYNTLTVTTATPVVINSISVAPPAPAWVIDASSTCHVGQIVAASCTLVLNGGNGC